MAKKVDITKVVASAMVFGPTEYDEAEKVLATMPKTAKIMRSDYFDKLKVAIADNNSKYIKTASTLSIQKPDSAKGINGDHPYVTHEKPAKRADGSALTYRAWRYIAILG